MKKTKIISTIATIGLIAGFVACYGTSKTDATTNSSVPTTSTSVSSQKYEETNDNKNEKAKDVKVEKVYDTEKKNNKQNNIDEEIGYFDYFDINYMPIISNDTEIKSFKEIMKQIKPDIKFVSISYNDVKDYEGIINIFASYEGNETLFRIKVEYKNANEYVNGYHLSYRVALLRPIVDGKPISDQELKDWESKGLNKLHDKNEDTYGYKQYIERTKFDPKKSKS